MDQPAAGSSDQRLSHRRPSHQRPSDRRPSDQSPSDQRDVGGRAVTDTTSRPDDAPSPDARTASPDGVAHRQNPHRWMVLAIVGCAQLMVVLDTTIVNIALPSAQSDLGFSTTSRQWIVTAYSLAFGSLLLLGGKLSGLLGRRRTLLIGLLGFAGASALGGAAPNFAALVTARGLQGVFAAILAPAALSTLNLTFTEQKERARAFAVFAGVAVGGSVIGLIVGGMLTEWLSWRWCLYVNLIFALPAAAGVLTYVIEREEADRGVRVDWLGVAAVSGGLFCLVYGLANAETHSWGNTTTIAMLVAGALLLAAFLALEARVSSPLLPLRVLADRNRAGSYLAIALAFCSLFSASLFLTYYLQKGLDYSPVKTGLAFLPLSVGVVIASGVTNTVLLPRLGPRPLVPTGMLIAAGAMFWLTQLSPSSTYAGDVLGPAFILGLGMGFTFAPSLSTATAAIDPADAGVGSAMVSTSQQIGGAVGTAAMSTIFTSALTRYLTSHAPHPTAGASTGGSAAKALLARLQEAGAIHGYTVAFSVSCGLFLTGSALTALLLRSGRLPSSQDGSVAVG